MKEINIKEKETNFRNAERALTITTVLTFFVAGFEVFMAYSGSKPGMNVFDVASYATYPRVIYCIVLILVNMILLPSAIMLYKKNDISIMKEITQKKTLVRDILFGIGALAVTCVLSLVYSYGITLGGTDMSAYNQSDLSLSTTVMSIIALAFVSGIFKEIYFRGLAKCFVGKVMGETQALLLFNLMFAMLDWYNFGFSFAAGLVWIFAYKKTNHLLPGMIAHGGANLAAIIYAFVVNGVM